MAERLGSRNGLFGFVSLAVAVWLAGESQAQAPVKLPPEKGSIRSLAFSRDGKLLASCTLERADGIKLWDVATGKVVRVLQYYPGRIEALLFTPDGKSLVSVGRDRLAKVWYVCTGEASLSFQIQVADRLVVTPDGKTLIVSGTSDLKGSSEAASQGHARLANPDPQIRGWSGTRGAQGRLQRRGMR